jgi:hypothetical protein
VLFLKKRELIGRVNEMSRGDQRTGVFGGLRLKCLESGSREGIVKQCVAEESMKNGVSTVWASKIVVGMIRLFKMSSGC